MSGDADRLALGALGADDAHRAFDLDFKERDFLGEHRRGLAEDLGGLGAVVEAVLPAALPARRAGSAASRSWFLASLTQLLLTTMMAEDSVVTPAMS
jgi:hypothetical protein